MTLIEALKERTEGRELHLRNPDVRGTYIFSDKGAFAGFITDDGIDRVNPLLPSDIERSDWSIAPIAQD